MRHRLIRVRQSGIVFSLIFATLLTGCGFVAEHAAAPKHATTARSEAATRADALFWETLHSGNYDGIATALEAETGAYLENPDDDRTAAHVGWLHIWRLSERERLGTVPATITDDIALSRRYFQEAVNLNPGDARYLGFLASSIAAEGNIHHDERLQRRGYFMLKDAIRAWPEFNLFTAGYVMSGLPRESKGFRQALEWQWRNLDVCVGATVDRVHPDYARYMPLEAHSGSKRVCWNSDIAPHNLEGFFLNMGDMLVKSGDWRTGQAIYANARLSATYATWPYREVLESRLREAQANVERFNAADGAASGKSGDAHIMFQSRFSCMACHQR